MLDMGLKFIWDSQNQWLCVPLSVFIKYNQDKTFSKNTKINDSEDFVFLQADTDGLRFMRSLFLV